MKYTLYKNHNEIQTFKNKVDLYEYWNRLNEYLKKTNNFDCSAGFWMMNRERNIYEAESTKGKVKYDVSEYEKLLKKVVDKK